jgi:hypothetical protein
MATVFLPVAVLVVEVVPLGGDVAQLGRHGLVGLARLAHGVDVAEASSDQALAAFLLAATAASASLAF